MTAAELLAQYLKARVNRVYCFPGGTISYLLHCIALAGIDAIVGRSESIGHAAQGAFRVSGKPQVVLTTSGPGVTNLLTSVADAYYDSDAVIYLTGQVATTSLRPSPSLRQYGFQETPTVELARPITKMAEQANFPESIMAFMEIAFRVVLEGRPGPVLLDIPMDVALEEVDAA